MDVVSLTDFNVHYLWVVAGLMGEHRARDGSKQGKADGKLVQTACSERDQAGRQTGSSLHVPVLGEEVVEHSQCGLQVTVDNVFWPGFRLF